ncbi:MAG: hypothetical protein MR936_02010 [Eubacterium sp.]|nr:hypothetical protein [Eubacterium sp.]
MAAGCILLFGIIVFLVFFCAVLQESRHDREASDREQEAFLREWKAKRVAKSRNLRYDGRELKDFDIGGEQNDYGKTIHRNRK